jgi:hypothetical protein
MVLRWSCLLSLVVVVAGCGGNESKGGGAGNSGLDDGGMPTFATYFQVDFDSDCSDGIIAELGFNPDDRTGTVAARSCAPEGTRSGVIPPDTVEYHSRFPEYLVSEGDIFVKEEQLAEDGGEPVAYCRTADDETMVELFRFGLAVSEDVCLLQRTYRDPEDGYYTSGGGSSPCEDMAYSRDESQLTFEDSDNIGVTIALDAGSHVGGYPGAGVLVLRYSTGARLEPSMQCWVTPE